MSATTHFGGFVRDVRNSKRLSLRDFCHKVRMDPSEINRIERGVAPPPQSESKIKAFAKALNIPVQGAKWNKFLALAIKSKDVIIEDNELILPAFPRNNKYEKPNKSELMDFVRVMRNS